MTGPPTVSVALCTYRGAPYLSRQLESVLSQTVLPDEMVVCDDASDDGTLAIVDEFRSRASFPVRRHVNERRLGATKNFEQAIRLCRSAWIMLCDQDDIWHPRKVERMLEACAGSAAVFTDGFLVDANDRRMVGRLWKSVGFTPRRRRHFRCDPLSVLCRVDIVTGATLMFHADLRELLLPIPEGWFHDAWIGLMAACAADLTMLPEPLISYRVHDAQRIGIGGGRPAGAGRRERMSAAADRYREARERLERAGSARADAVAELDAKCRHLRARAESASRGDRLRLVVSQLLGGQYRRYSNGVRSAARDLLSLERADRWKSGCAR